MKNHTGIWLSVFLGWMPSASRLLPVPGCPLLPCIERVRPWNSTDCWTLAWWSTSSSARGVSRHLPTSTHSRTLAKVWRRTCFVKNHLLFVKDAYLFFFNFYHFFWGGRGWGSSFVRIFIFVRYPKIAWLVQAHYHVHVYYP